MFKVPSTPDSRRGIDDDDHPSTTPAGPPPTGFTNQSFTPAGNPPSSVFGSSFGLNPKPLSFSNFAKGSKPDISQNTNRASSNTFRVPSSSPPDATMEYTFENGNQQKKATDSRQKVGLEVTQPTYNGRTGNRAAEDDIIDFQDSPRGAKRSRNGNVMATSMRASRAFGTEVERKSTMAEPAGALASGLTPPQDLSMDDQTVLQTEAILIRLDEAAKTKPEQELERSAQQASEKLSEVWSDDDDVATIPASIGPVDKHPDNLAIYIANLLFATYQPHALDRKEPQTQSSVTSLVSPAHSAPYPKALLDWLNTYHNPFPEDLPEVQATRPSSTSHERFWDTIFQTLLRGHISTVIALLEGANWSHADSALEDGYDTRGYTGAQLKAVQEVVGRCTQLLRTCPAVADGDWAVTGTDWQLFRARTRRTLEALEEYAEADAGERNATEAVNLFAASAAPKGSFAAGTRRAESRVPWTVYEQLKAVYGQLLGFREEILLSAQDWLEATIYLAVWWDGEDDVPGRRSGIGRQKPRTVDLNPGIAYRRRLVNAFASVTDEPEDSMLRVNAIDPVQVALGCVLEDEVEAVLKLLLKWSPLVAASVVDVASVSGWMPEGRPRTGDIMDGFDQEDLMVLSHGQTDWKKELDRDSVLIEYAELLARHPEFKSANGSLQAGWELAVRVLSRLDSASTAQRKISDMFAHMKFSDTKQVDTALAVCNELGLSDQVRNISERYADELASKSQSYGPALLYYARAHSAAQLQSTVDLLLSTSLVRSASYPAFGDLDAQLEELLRDQATVLNRMARTDYAAAKLLSSRLSGYATLRRFYDLRDEDSLDSDEPGSRKKSGMKLPARRKEMALAIVTLIDSAAESIRGGLFDQRVQAVVQVDALLALLGEALPLLTLSTPVLTKRQLLTILRAAEDLETVSSRIREQANALFQACMSDYHSAGSTEPLDLAKSLMLARSTSGLSGSSSTYGLVNSKGSIESEKASQQGRSKGQAAEDASGKHGGKGADSSGLDEDKGWDWRRGIALTAGKKVSAEDVLRLLRIGVAGAMGRSWTEARSR